MSMLIHANLKRMFRSGVFLLCIVVSAGFGWYITLMSSSAVLMETRNADDCLFLGLMEELFISAVFTGFFVGTDYSDGTIRNKLAAGHTRPHIYLANLITCVIASGASMLVYTGTAAVLCRLWGMSVTLPAREVFMFMFCARLILTAQCALALLLAMLISKKSVSAVTMLILTGVMMGVSLNLSANLSAPETYYLPEQAYQEYEEMLEDLTPGEVPPAEPTGPATKEIENPYYLRGFKRTVYENLHNLLPTSQAYQIMSLEDENITAILLYDVLLIVVTTGIGIAGFRKKDLK